MRPARHRTAAGTKRARVPFHLLTLLHTIDHPLLSRAATHRREEAVELLTCKCIAAMFNLTFKSSILVRKNGKYLAFSFRSGSKADDPDLLWRIEMGNCTGPRPISNSDAWFQKSHGHCDGYTPFNGIDLPPKLCKGSQKDFSSDQWRWTSLHNSHVPSGHRLAWAKEQLYKWARIFLKRDGVTTTSPVQKNPARYCTTLP